MPLPLADAVIFLMPFLELSGDDVVDPDSAVSALESACHDLQQLSREQRQALCERAEQLASHDWRTHTRLPEFLRTFGDACGLLDEE